MDLLKKGLSEWKIEININVEKKFRMLLEEINKWNEVGNITAIKENDQIIIKHFIDSISSSNFIKYSNQEIIDIGTGGGFPGLPLKLLFNELKIVFVDSSIKKMNILSKICKNIEIQNYKVISENIENIGKSIEYRERFDIGVSRAVSNLNVLLEYGIPLIKVGGKLIIYKGPNSEEEVENSEKALHILNSRIIENVDFILSLSDYKRKILVVEKLGKTTIKYPRNVGIPKKRPL